MSKSLEEDILEAYAKYRSHFRVAKSLGITMVKVRDVVGDEPINRSKTREAKYGGQGRPELRRYLVATKSVDTQWDNSDEGIANARRNYEAGTHEMATGRDGDTLLLYAIPRAVTQPRPNYFTLGHAIV